MPYGYRKSGDNITVFKKKPDGSTEVVGHTTASKLKGYLAALHIHSKDMNELSQAAKAAKIKAAQEKLKSLKLQVTDAQKELDNVNKEPVTAESFSLSNYIKTILEAEGDTPEDIPAEEAPEDAPADDEKDNTKASKSDSMEVKFNMAKVMKYNQYPVTDNVGTVTGVTKQGLSVQVGDNIIFVDFEDLLD